jgi:hypothetical protein
MLSGAVPAHTIVAIAAPANDVSMVPQIDQDFIGIDGVASE